MERQFWAVRGNKKTGPHATREAAVDAFRTRFPAPASKATGKRFDIMTGYGAGGPWFDIQWVSAKAGVDHGH